MMKDADDAPVRLPSGKIGCGRCGTALVIRNAPFYIREEHVGSFQSHVCPICNYSALTEDGYKESMKQARRMALVGEQKVPGTHKI